MWINRLRRTPIFLLFVVVAALPAQEPDISANTLVDQVELHRWLHSGDPRLIAWAADFARRKHDTTIIAEMPALLEHGPMLPQYNGNEAQAVLRRAAGSMLDALIQENVPVPIPTIEAIASSFPAQAAILIGRLPLSQSKPTLFNWTNGATGSWSERTLARVASMMLANDPLPSAVMWNREIGFAAGIVNASEVDVDIRIRNSSATTSGIGSGTCGDSWGHELTPGWPQVYAYTLEESNNQKMDGQIVVDLDGDQVFSQRISENAGWGTCNSVEALDPTTRHRLIAHWLGIAPRDMSWQPVDRFTIVWTDETAYEIQLGKIIETERHKLYSTVDSLRDRGLLRQDESAMPRLEVRIRCDMKPCPLR